MSDIQRTATTAMPRHTRPLFETACPLQPHSSLMYNGHDISMVSNSHWLVQFGYTGCGNYPFLAEPRTHRWLDCRYKETGHLLSHLLSDFSWWFLQDCCSLICLDDYWHQGLQLQWLNLQRKGLKVKDCFQLQFFKVAVR